jgi:hypothetical protein
MTIEFPLTSNTRPRLRPNRHLHVKARSFLFKEVKRYIRSTAYRLWCRIEPARNWPFLLVCALCSCILFFVAGAVTQRLETRFFAVDEEPLGTEREAQHFSRKTRFFVPRQLPIQKADLSPCSWLYLEVNALDGRDLRGFFENGNGIFEETLRAELSFARGFCAVALEPDASHRSELLDVRKSKAQFTKRFDVFPGVSCRSTRRPRPSSVEIPSVVDLPTLILKLTFALLDSAAQIYDRMAFARANGHPGSVVVRISGSSRELYSHIVVLNERAVLCDRVDRLILNVTQDTRDPHQGMDGQSHADILTDGIEHLVRFAGQIDALNKCRTRIFIFDVTGSLEYPKPLGSKSVLYAILAGAPTFNKRIAAQVGSWLQAVPVDRVALYTNLRNEHHIAIAGGFEVAVVQPYKPKLERTLSKMQSWSHLVRVRESWDRYMREDSSVKWLVLLDDDTFVFPAGLTEYLSFFDERLPIWGGSAEQARVDNGDHGDLALWLRNLSVSHGGEFCYLENEPITADKASVERGEMSLTERRQGLNRQGKDPTLPRMCGDTFCRRGCPAVPQGAAIVMSRALVKLLRPVIEHCEVQTSRLCERCGSQRLYMCVNRFVDANAQTLMTRGVCRSPWKVEHRASFPFALTFHGFDRYGQRGLSAGSIGNDMRQLWKVGARYEHGAPWQRRVPMQEIANLIGCPAGGRYMETSSSCEPFNDTHIHPSEVRNL